MNSIAHFLFFVFIITLLMTGCKDSPKNVETKAVTLQFQEVYLTENNKRLQADSFPKVRYGTKLKMYITDFKGYNLKKGKAFLGCAVEITDESGKQIQKQEDILKTYETLGITPEDAKNLMTSMVVSTPLEVGKKYFWTARLWDKIGAGEIMAKTQIEVISANPVQITQNGLTIQEAFLISYDSTSQEASRLHNNQVKAGHQLKLHLAGVQGFKQDKNGVIQAGCTLEIRDRNGQLILMYKDMFEPYTKGVQSKEVEQMTLNLVTSKPPQAGERYDLIARIWDKQTEKSAELTLNFEILE